MFRDEQPVGQLQVLHFRVPWTAIRTHRLGACRGLSVRSTQLHSLARSFSRDLLAARSLFSASSFFRFSSANSNAVAPTGKSVMHGFLLNMSQLTHRVAFAPTRMGPRARPRRLPVERRASSASFS